MKPLTPAFPEGTKFFNVEGVPVSLTPEGVCKAWDPEPRRFPLSSVYRNGTIITFEEFRADVDRANFERLRAMSHKERSRLIAQEFVDSLNKGVRKRHGMKPELKDVSSTKGEDPEP
ncbi:MAG: hypothetical protein ACOZDY_18580 [Pseudomonadota bacterium]